MIEDRQTTLEYGRFFLPGPTEVRPETLAAMAQPVIGHRSEEIQALIGAAQPGLKHLFGTKRPVYISTSSATGMMEAAITNLSRKRVLCLVCGAFSGRFHAIAEATGRQADRLAVEWGEANLPEDLREVLSADPDRYDLVTVVHSETSTGTLNPVREIAAVVAEYDDILLAVDTVSSMGGAPLRMDEWGLDYVLTGSQKALAVPPGISLAAASERAIARAGEIEHRGFYFDLLKFEKSLDRLMTPNTPPADGGSHAPLGSEARGRNESAFRDRRSARIPLPDGDGSAAAGSRGDERTRGREPAQGTRLRDRSRIRQAEARDGSYRSHG
jgi:aspartate aminotransferase-like enzyme